ncbi:hypothetical protein LEMLEM_LOCUS18637 [Lemmus lemmus]
MLNRTSLRTVTCGHLERYISYSEEATLSLHIWVCLSLQPQEVLTLHPAFKRSLPHSHL